MLSSVRYFAVEYLKFDYSLEMLWHVDLWQNYNLPTAILAFVLLLIGEKCYEIIALVDIIENVGFNFRRAINTRYRK